MNPSALRSTGLLYAAILVLGIGVIATSAAMVVQAASEFMQPVVREKTALDLQIESARDIRAALKRPIIVPPLPPITAHPRHEMRSVAREGRNASPQEQMIPVAAENAVAMGGPPAQRSYNALLDRHRPQ